MTSFLFYFACVLTGKRGGGGVQPPKNDGRRSMVAHLRQTSVTWLAITTLYHWNNGAGWGKEKEDAACPKKIDSFLFFWNTKDIFGFGMIYQFPMEQRKKTLSSYTTWKNLFLIGLSLSLFCDIYRHCCSSCYLNKRKADTIDILVTHFLCCLIFSFFVLLLIIKL